MIHERLMTQGSFEIPLKRTTPWTVWEDCDTLGHMVILPQWVDLEHYDDTALLGLARYTGVLLDKRVNDDRMWFGGAGLVWWLGDDRGVGDINEANVALNGSTLSNALDQLLPDSITKGTVTEPDITYSGEHHFETPLQALRTVMFATSAEFEVQPDGTIDAGSNYDLFPSIDNPTVVVVRHGFGGGTDPTYTGIPNNFIEGRFTSREYITRAILTTVDVDGAETLEAGSNRSGVTKTDIHGNTVVRKHQAHVPSNDLSGYGYYLNSNLDTHDDQDEVRLRTDFYEVANGTWRVGDAYHVYDPPMLRDTTNQINFRGDTIYPKVLRLIETSWTIRERMGVYHRSPAASPVWTDLTEYVDEELTDSIAVLRNVERNQDTGC